MSMPRYTCIESTDTSSQRRVPPGERQGEGRLPGRGGPDEHGVAGHAPGVDGLGEAHGLGRVLVVPVGRDAVPAVALVEGHRLGLGEAGLQLEVAVAELGGASLEGDEERPG